MHVKLGSQGSSVNEKMLHCTNADARTQLEADRIGGYNWFMPFANSVWGSERPCQEPLRHPGMGAAELRAGLDWRLDELDPVRLRRYFCAPGRRPSRG